MITPKKYTNLNNNNKLNNEDNIKNFKTSSTMEEEIFKNEVYSSPKLTDLQFNDLIFQLNNFEICNKKFLKNHKIDSDLRAKIINWMIEVINKLEQKEDVLYKSIQIMDLYFYFSEKTWEPKNILNIAVISIVIASKLNEEKYITIQIAHEYLLKKKVDIKILINLEIHVLEIIKFKISLPYYYDLMISLVNKMDLKNKLNSNLFNFFKHTVNMFLKMIFFDYEILSNYSSIDIVCITLTISFKLISKNHSNYNSICNLYIKEIFDIINFKYEENKDIILKLHSYLIGFEHKYKDLKNIYKYYNMSI